MRNSERRQVDVVVFDINMPSVGGVRRATWPQAKWPQMPTLLLSGFLPQEARAVLLKPNVRFIRKPISVDSLSEVIKQTLRVRHRTGMPPDPKPGTLDAF